MIPGVQRKADIKKEALIVKSIAIGRLIRKISNSMKRLFLVTTIIASIVLFLTTLMWSQYTANLDCSRLLLKSVHDEIADYSKHSDIKLHLTSQLPPRISYIQGVSSNPGNRSYIVRTESFTFLIFVAQYRFVIECIENETCIVGQVKLTSESF
ncbi:hypothetical protein CCB80_01705 [Armatimonadetes bacterium Uphvl-Ar1]|nr:hypothetical protein CCB80_01705 [Armatimonadetes bacterium Uphvl-Ar1]